MQCRLGSLRPDMGAVTFSPHMQVALRRALDAWHREVASDHRSRAAVRRAYEHAVERSLRDLHKSLRDAPDLAESLGPDHQDRAWVERATDCLVGLRAGARPRLCLLNCDWNQDTGRIAVAVDDPSCLASVRVGDTISAGCAIVRDEDGGLCVMPRIYRKSCANGAVIHEGVAQDVMASSNTFEAAIERCFAAEVVRDAVDRFRAADRIPVPDPVAILARTNLRTPPLAVLDAWRSEPVRTGWGLLNAITAAARREGDFTRRIEMEKDAARLLTALGARAGRVAPHLTSGRELELLV